MKKFFILSLLAVAGVIQALACGPWSRPNYYMFHVYDDGLFTDYDEDSAVPTEADKFWIDYTGGKADMGDVNRLSWVDLEKWNKSDNEIVKAIIAKNDYEAEIYVKRLVKYLKNCDKLNGGSWYYPDEAELAEVNKEMEGLRAQAMGYEGTRFKNQYALLVMRTNMVQKRYRENLDYWRNTASKLPKSAYTNLMRGIYANALCNTGGEDEARLIYAELGDTRSLEWMLRKKRNLAGIKEEYARDPKSPMIPYLVEDFVNNAQETMDADGDAEWVKTVGRRAIYAQEVKDFISFAEGVAKKKNCPDGMMWLSAAGLLKYYLGDKQGGLTALENSLKLKGNERMKNNARWCLILVKSASITNFDDATQKWLADEMEWLEMMGRHNVYAKNATSRIADEALMPLFKNDKLHAMELLTWLDANDVSNWSGECYTFIDQCTAADLERFYSHLKSGKLSRFDVVATRGIKIEQTLYDDMMGTKLIREGKFEQAIPYLEKVPLSYICKQGIARYMMYRDYNTERWFKRQIVDYDDDRYAYEDSYNVKENQKLTYCRKVVALQNQLEKATGEKAHQLEYQLANLYLQAGHDGDCWYLSNYSWSSYYELGEGQFDFTIAAQKMLDRAFKTDDPELRMKTAYARAFLPIETCWEYDYDYRTDKYKWNLTTTNGYNYFALKSLASIKRTAGKSSPRYLTRCDVLKNFMASTR